MTHDNVAKLLAELGNSTRLAIFRYLVKAGPAGAPVGKIQDALDVPGSTLSHHISRLVYVGLVKQERESRTLHCLPQFDVINEVMKFLMAECCAGVDGGKGSGQSALCMPPSDQH